MDRIIWNKFPAATILGNSFPMECLWPVLPYNLGISLLSSNSEPLASGMLAAAKSLQSCPTLCDPIDGSPPGSFIHGIFQARVLEWGAIALSALFQ